MRPPEKRRGPATRAKVTGPEISSANQIEIHDASSEAVVRCSRCNLPLSAPKSIKRELGPVCSHLVAESVVA